MLISDHKKPTICQCRKRQIWYADERRGMTTKWRLPSWSFDIAFCSSSHSLNHLRSIHSQSLATCQISSKTRRPNHHKKSCSCNCTCGSRRDLSLGAPKKTDAFCSWLMDGCRREKLFEESHYWLLYIWIFLQVYYRSSRQTPDGSHRDHRWSCQVSSMIQKILWRINEFFL